MTAQSANAANGSNPAPAKSEKKAVAKKKSGKPGLIQRAKDYFAGVRTEIKRVVWPSKQELVKYTLAVVGMLVFFGVLIFLVDQGATWVLYKYAGLR